MNTKETLVVLENMELDKVFKELFENKEELAKHAPQLSYAVNPIYDTFLQKKLPATIIAEGLVNAIKKFSFLPVVDKQVKLLENIFELFGEKIMVYNTIYSLKEYRHNNFFQSLNEKLDKYLNDSLTRTEMISELEQHQNFKPAKFLLVNLIKNSDKKELYIVNENDAYEVNKIYSFLDITPEDKTKHRFYNSGQVFEKEGDKLRILTKEEVFVLPKLFVELNSFISQPFVYINENSVYVTAGKDVIKMTIDDKKAFINEKEITCDNLVMPLIHGNLHANTYLEVYNSIQKVWENLDSLVEVDFGKNINLKESRYIGATVYKLNENFYLYKFNPIKKINEWVENITGLQTRNLLLEAIGYDINESLYDYIGGDIKKIGVLKDKQKEINNEISELHKNIEKINVACLENEEVANNDEVNSLRSVLENHISSLKETFGAIQQDIDRLQKPMVVINVEDNMNKTAANSFKVGQIVKMKSGNRIGKVLSIDTTSNKLNIMFEDSNFIQAVDATDVSKDNDELEPPKDLVPSKDEPIGDVQGNGLQVNRIMQ